MIMSIPLISIIGKSKSGKTTLLEKLIPELKRRGYRVATIKHHAHAGLEFDNPGKDTWRYAQAGSDVVVIAGPDKLATIRQLEHELTLDEIAASIQDVDIILTEGFKKAGKLAIEVVRQERGQELIGDPGQLLAVASDAIFEMPTQWFHLNDVRGIADLIELRLLVK
jgi:molybdopterin-guanine dinucleotide biosynthesis adapter protein